MDLPNLIANNFSKKVDFKNFLVLQSFPENFINQQLRRIISPHIDKFFKALIKRVEDEESFPDEFKPIMKKLVLVFTLEFLKLIKEKPGAYDEETRSLEQEGDDPILFDLAGEWADLVYDHLLNRETQLFINKEYLSFLPNPLGENLNRFLYMVIFDFWPEEWDDPLTVNFVKNRIIEMFQEPIFSKF